MNHWEHANANYNEIPLHSNKNGYKKKKLELEAFIHCFLEYTIVQFLWQFFEKLKVKLSYDPVIPILEILKILY